MHKFLSIIRFICVLAVAGTLLGCPASPASQKNPPETLTADSSNGSSGNNSAASRTKSENNRQLSEKNCHNERIFAQYRQQNPQQKSQVLGCGEIIKVLKDDNDGSRHQKFLVKIDNYPQITVLIAHNIDLAPRIEPIQANTPIRFYGEYIYNEKGGVIHWTHKDPAARHQDGWLEYRGQKYW